ncbi:MAG: metallophosphatase [Acidobacteria bacterium]|nr:metallophosphatase [Acidobacteriota bacterium]
MRVYKDIGGIARRTTIAKCIRQELDSRRTPVWFVDLGDYSDGTPFSSEYHGEADVAAMNAAGYDMGTLGNHEFNNTAAQLRKLVGATKYQLLCANATDRASGKPLVPPYVVKTLGSLRIGVFGLLAHESATYPAGKEAIEVGDEIASARQAVAALRPQADIIVLLSHAGEQVDQRLAEQVPDIDVIVGSHSHSRLPSGELIWHSEDLQARAVNGTVIVQAHQWGGELGGSTSCSTKTRRASGTWNAIEPG